MKKFVSILLCTAMLLGCMAALSSCNETPTGKASALTLNVGSIPDTIDPALNSAVDGATYIIHSFTGLFGYEKTADGKLELVPQCAQELPEAKQLEGGKVSYTFKLRDGLKWSDGSDLTAQDFVYAWNRAVDPVTGADYAYMFEVVDGYDDVIGMYEMTKEKNEEGEEVEVFAKDEAGNPKYKDGRKSLNVTATDDGKEITVVLKTYVPYFFELLAFPTYMPVKKDIIEEKGESWATAAETYIGNGPYKVTEFTQAHLKLEKDPNWYNADKVKIEQIIFAFNDDDSSLLSNYKNGSYLFIDSVPNDEIESLKQEYPDEFFVEGQLGTYYVCFNVNDPVLKDFSEEERIKIRHAISLLFDRNHIVEDIGKAGQIPASAFVAIGLTEPDGAEFVTRNGPNRDGKGYFSVEKDDYSTNCDEAVKLFKEVASSSGKFTVADDGKLSGFPTITYITNEGSGHEAIAAYIQEILRKYGITVQVEKQEWATFLQTRKMGNYSVARNGWLGDYNDPISFLDMWTTDSGNNDTQFGKGAHANYAGFSYEGKDDLTWAESYDKIISRVKTSENPEERFKLMHEAEDILMDTGAICPIYYYTDIYMCSPKIEGFYSSPLGYKFFMYASLKEEPKQ